MTGIIGALDIEVKGIIEKMTDHHTETVSGTEYTIGKLYGKECVVAKCGIGKVNAAITAQTMILEYAPERVINTGIAGSTSHKTKIGHVVIAEKVVQHDMDTTALGDEAGTLFLPDGSILYIPCDKKIVSGLENACIAAGEEQFVTGIIATGDAFISGNDRRMGLNKKFGSLACEMEGGSIGQVCFVNKVPFGIIRSISDSMSEDDTMEYSVFSKAAAEKAIDIICAFMQQ